LLRFGRDRRLWSRWLYEARVRHGLCVLDYIVTSNHVHLVVRDQGRGEVAASMQLLEGCTGQAYNRRKQRLGAFWQDRYHATAVESGEHLARCVVYVDLNMVRAGVVPHPREWTAGGYHEIQGHRQRYRIVDRVALAEALEVDVEKLAEVHRSWVEEALRGPLTRQAEWSESVAVGGRRSPSRCYVISEGALATVASRRWMVPTSCVSPLRLTLRISHPKTRANLG
jgi:putative transposase